MSHGSPLMFMCACMPQRFISSSFMKEFASLLRSLSWKRAIPIATSLLDIQMQVCECDKHCYSGPACAIV